MRTSASYILKKIFTLVLHIFFWIGVLLFYTYYFGFGSSDIDYIFNFSLFLMPITIGVTYVMVYKLIPDYLLQKRYFKFGLYSIYTIIISSYLIVVSVFYGLIYLSNFQVEGMAPISRNIAFVLIGVYLVVLVVSLFKLLRLNARTSVEKSKLETVHAETNLKLKEHQLNYLKMQIHPHFLFNTLNTIYGYALKKKDEAPEMILKLSNLLDYLLYQTDKQFVLLSKEIEHLKDYIDLEKLRFGDSLKIDFNFEEINPDYKIAPMVLLPFVENSFKHGGIVDGKKSIVINLKTLKNELYFEIFNDKATNIETEGGIGLKNITTRLELLYPNQHHLQIGCDNEIMDNQKFSICLKLFKSITDE